MTRPIQRDGWGYDDGRVELVPRGATGAAAPEAPDDPDGRMTEMATMPGNRGKVVNLLNDLIQLDYDAIEAYSAATARLSEVGDKNQLTEFMDDHRRHTQDLAVLVRNLGGAPAGGADFKQVLTRGKVMIGALAGDDAILRAMKSNEETTLRAYEKALRAEGLAPGVREVLDRNLGDERRHRAWIEARLGRRLFTQSPPEAPRH